MALLRIEGLTLQFGGLTAVKEFDLAVEPGEIVSIIGPNGAGKTTVFNAVTGIYEPTRGKIVFEDAEIVRPFSLGVALAALLVAIVTGLGLGLLGLNLDRLWRATLRRPFDTEQAIKNGFGAAADLPSPTGEPRVATFWQALASYVSAEPVVEFSDGSWKVLSPDGNDEFASDKSEFRARELRGDLLKAARGEPSSHAFSELVLRRLAESQVRTTGRVQLFWYGAVGGFVLGFAGYLAVWMRSRRTTDLIARSGLARTFQNIRLFHNMTVLENVLVGMDKDYPSNWLGMLLWWPGHREAEKEANAKAVELLKFVELDERQESLAKDLPYGQQRRLEIARALATRPKLLLLDEPAAGTNPTESEELMHLIRSIRDRGVTVLLIEHHMQLVMGISDRIAVLEHGVKIAEGTPDEVRTNQRVIDAYLGQGDDH